MIKYVYAYRDRKLGYYREPFYDTVEPKRLIDIISRVDFSKLTENDKKFYSDHEVYFLGTFDDITCKFDCSTPSFVIDLSALFTEEDKDESK